MKYLLVVVSLLMLSGCVTIDAGKTSSHITFNKPALVGPAVSVNTIYDNTIISPSFTDPPKETVAPPVETLDKVQLACLAEAVYFEARGEPISGQAGVAYVIINRTKDSSYPNTICGVVHQRVKTIVGKKHARYSCAFSYRCDGSARRPHNTVQFGHSEDVSKLVMLGMVPNPVGNSLYFHASHVKTPVGKNYRVSYKKKIGNQLFYALAKI